MRKHPGERSDVSLSVAEPLRHKGRLEVHMKAQALATYTARILMNENIFDPKIDDVLVNKIKDCAYSIYTKSWQANKVNAGTNRIQREMRYRLQEEAILLCDELHACIGIAKTLYHLKDKRMKFWSGQITEVRKLLQAWKESDVDRYGQP